MSSSSSTTEAPLPRAGTVTSGCYSPWVPQEQTSLLMPFPLAWWDALVLFLEADDRQLL